MTRIRTQLLTVASRVLEQWAIILLSLPLVKHNTHTHLFDLRFWTHFISN